MSRVENELAGLKHLGSQGTEYVYQYNPGLLETFPNKHTDADYMVTLLCPEFTSLCPKTGQPDYAKIIINYIPDRLMVESKSLKLYLFSFRNHGDFHEDCVNIILHDLVRLMQPRYIEVVGLFTPRGGIAIHPFANYADAAHKELAAQRLSSAMPLHMPDRMY
ncbi:MULTISPECIES: preQ(1) synthase [Muribaculum]|jgi:7-cyano-7-deazaguanine reductase|uniref:NADPH-dependent 7-cyano-7-deazaguanine reductase QueF n=1 Tax=Muribaculum caecicola TaxID=3038144 RepID=A0AC61S464_9BACT|nr:MULTISPECIES: preQ(1) synthase [Muribaculum]THG46979.1 NADPH-dependent 7-cyano-7-deazaguanine reductase QueF [Muribaculum caecicola]